MKFGVQQENRNQYYMFYFPLFETLHIYLQTVNLISLQTLQFSTSLFRYDFFESISWGHLRIDLWSWNGYKLVWDAMLTNCANTCMCPSACRTSVAIHPICWTHNDSAPHIVFVELPIFVRLIIPDSVLSMVRLLPTPIYSNMFVGYVWLCKGKCEQLRALSHWGRVTHICANKITIIGSDNGLSPGRRQAII